MRIKEAMDSMKETMKNDIGYANTWHDNLATVIMDSGIDYNKANEIASRLMKHCFNVKTVAPPERLGER